jgi:hypothetical protein
MIALIVGLVNNVRIVLVARGVIIVNGVSILMGV